MLLKRFSKLENGLETPTPFQMGKFPSLGKHVGTGRKHLGQATLAKLSILALSLATETQDYDMNGKHVTYFLEALMISHNPKAVVFYHETTLFNLFVTPRTPSMGKDFTINNTCCKDELHFLSELLLQIRTVQRSIQRLLASHGYTSLIKCDSYLQRYYQYSTGSTATMNCPYGYRNLSNYVKYGH